MTTIACPVTLTSVPILALSGDCVVTGPVSQPIPDVRIAEAETGRHALEKLAEAAAFAFATRAAYDSLPPNQKREILELAEIISHNISGRIFVGSGMNEKKLDEIKVNLGKGSRGICVAQKQTNYYRAAGAFERKFRSCCIHGVDFSRPNIDQSDIDYIIEYEPHYVIFMGLNSWLDTICAQLMSDDVFRGRYPYDPIPLTKDIGTETFSIYARLDVVTTGDNLSKFREIIIRTNAQSEKPHDALEITLSSINKQYQSKVMSDSFGAIKEYLAEIDFAIAPKMRGTVAYLWREELKRLELALEASNGTIIK